MWGSILFLLYSCLIWRILWSFFSSKYIYLYILIDHNVWRCESNKVQFLLSTNNQWHFVIQEFRRDYWSSDYCIAPWSIHRNALKYLNYYLVPHFIVFNARIEIQVYNYGCFDIREQFSLEYGTRCHDNTRRYEDKVLLCF